MKKFLTVAGILVFCAGLGWGQTYTWEGASSSNWDNPYNWSPAGYPGIASGHRVIIPSGTPYSPTLNVNTTYPLNSLTIYSGATLTLNRNLTVAGDITNDGTIDLRSDLAVAGNITNGGTINLSNNLAVAGNITNNGTISTSGGALTLNGSGDQNIQGTGTTTVYDLTVNKSGGTAALTGDITVTRDVTLTAGAVTGGGVLNVGRNWARTNGTYNGSGGTVVFTGTGGTIAAGGSAFGNLVIQNSSGTYTVNGDLTVQGDFSKTGNGTVNFPSTATPRTVAVDGSFSQKDVSIISFASTTGTVSLSANGITQENTARITKNAGGLMTITSTNGISLPNSNTIPNVALNNSAAGNIVYTNSANFTVSAENTAPGGDISINTSDTLTVGANGVTADDGDINLTANSITVNGGVTADDRNIALTANTMSIGAAVDAGTGTVAIKNASSGRTFSLGGTGGNIAVPNSQITAGTLEIGSSTAGNITVTGAFSLGGSSALKLETGGTVTQSGANRAITTGTLEVSAAGLITLNDPANAAAKLTITKAGGAVGFTNSTALDIGGISNIGNNPVTLTTTGTGSNITQSGVITTGTGTFEVKSAGAIALDTQNNKIGTIAITGAGGDVKIKNDAQALDIGGISNIGTYAVTLTTTGTGSGITQSGAIETDALTVNSAGAVTLNNPANSAAKLTITGAGGAVGFTNSTALDIGGVSGIGDSPVTLTTTGTGSNITQSGVITTGAGTLEVNSAGAIALDTEDNEIGVIVITSAGGDVKVKNDGKDLNTGGISNIGTYAVTLTTENSGGITQTGAIETDALTVKSAGVITLDTQANKIGTIAITGAGGAVAVRNDAQTLNTGGVSGIGDNPVTLTTTTSGGITQTGVITTEAGTLEVNSAGAIALDTEDNKIGTITITGAGGAVAVRNDGKDLNTGGISSIGNNPVTLTTTTSGGITQSGAIETDALTVNSAGAVTLNNPANSAVKLTITGAGGAVGFTNSTALDIGGVSNIGNNPVTLTTTGTGSNITVSGPVRPLPSSGNGNIVIASTGTIETTTSGTITGTGGAVTMSTPDNYGITIGAAISGIARLALKPGTSAASTGNVAINAAVSVTGNGTGHGETTSAVYVWAHDMTGSEDITPGSSGQACVWVDQHPSYTGAVTGNRVHIHPRSNGHIVYRDGADPGTIPDGYGGSLNSSEYFYIDSGSSLSLPVDYHAGPGKNVYIVDVGSTPPANSRIVTFEGSGGSFIEIRGVYQSSGALNLTPGTRGVRLAGGETSNSAAVTLTGNPFSTNGRPLTLLDDDASITAAGITLGGGITGTSNEVNNLTLNAGTAALNVTGAVGSTGTKLGNIGVTAGTVSFSNSSTVYAKSYTQTGTGSTTFNAAQNYTGDFSFTGTNLTVNNTLSAGGAVTIPSANNVTFAAAVTAASFTQNAGTGTTAFGGAQIYTAGFSFTGTSLTVNNTLRTDSDDTNDDGPFSFTGRDFTLNGGLTAGSGSSGAANTVTINNSGAFSTTGIISAGGVFSQNGAAGTVRIGANITTRHSTGTDASITFDDEIQLTGNVEMNSSTGGGDIVLAGDITRDTTARSLTLDAGGGTVNTAALGTSGSPLGAIAITGGAITINGIESSAKTSVTNTGLFTSNAAVVSDSGFEQLSGSTGSSILKADITTAGTLIKFLNPVTIDASTLTFDTGAGSGDISLAAVNGAGKNLTLTAGTGNITVSGTVGGTGADRLGILRITGANNVSFAAAVTADSFTQDAGTGTTAFGGAQDYAAGFSFTGNKLEMNDTLTAVGAITIPSAVDVTFAAAVSAGSFTQNMGTGTTAFGGVQNYAAGFSFNGTNLTVNNTLKTDTDTSGGDGDILITNAANNVNFIVGGPSGSILPGGSGPGGKITVNGNTSNNGTITAAVTNISEPIEFNGDYTSSAAGSLIGSTNTAAQTIMFRGDAAFGNFTPHGDRVQFSTNSMGPVTVHNVSKTGGGTVAFADAMIDGGNTVTVVAGTTVTQNPGGTLTLGNNAVLDAAGTWYIGPPSLLAPSWYMLSNPSLSSTGDPNYINSGPDFTTGFAGFNGTLTMEDGAVLNTKDFYTQMTGPGHTFTLKAPSGAGEMCTIEASGNITINEKFENAHNSSLTMTGSSAKLAVRTASGNPRRVDADLWNFTVNTGASVIINSDVNFKRRAAILGTLTGGASAASSPRIHVLPNDVPASQGFGEAEWEQPGTFTPRQSVVEFGDAAYAAWEAEPRTYTINGTTTWYDFVCREKGAEIKFSEFSDIHNVQHGFTVNPVPEGDNPTIPPWSTKKDAISIKLTRITDPSSPPLPPMPVPPSSHTTSSAFWVFNLGTGAVMNINFVRIKYSYSTRRLPVPPAFDFNWYVKAWPYYDDPSDPINPPPPGESFWDVNWFVFNNFFYSYTEDENHNGKIDRIRAQSAFELDGNFSDFDVSVDGYEIDRSKSHNGFAVAGSSQDKIDSIYIYLKEKDYTDGGAVLKWRITKNGSLKDLTAGANIIGNVGEEMITIDTVPPRLNYALTIPGSDQKQVYFQMSEPVNHTNPSKEGAAPIRAANVAAAHVSSGAPALKPVNSRSFSDRYGPVGEGALEYTFDLDKAYTVSELFGGNQTFDLEDVYDMAAPARDLHADNKFDRTEFLDPRFYFQYPSPKYPTGWDYSLYEYVIYNGGLYPDKDRTRPGRGTYEKAPPALSSSPALVPPHRLVDLSALPPPYGPPPGADGYKGYYSITHRVTDMLISVPPKDGKDTRYFVWPIWARYTDPANPSAVGGDDFWGQQINDTGIIWDFTGAKTLEDRDASIQVRVNGDLNSVPALQYSAEIPESYYARPVDSDGYGHGNPGLALPRVQGTLPPAPGTPPGFINLTPDYFQFTGAARVSGTGSLFVFNLKESVPGYESGGLVEFLLRLENSPPGLFAARLDIPRDKAIPSNWYQLVRPFSYGIRNVTLQRGGATILNNVINPNTGERTYIRYHLVKSGRVTIQVFTLDGTLVKTLRRESRNAGEWVDSWDGTNNGGRAVARGMYFIRVVGPGIDEIRKVMVVK